MEQVTQVQDQYYILATESRADERTRVLKHGETFAVFDQYGDVQTYGMGEEGLYHSGTRFLSKLELRLGDARPLLLSSTVKTTNDVLLVDLTNPDIPMNDEEVIPRGTVHVFRTKFVWRGTCYERFRVTNHGLTPIRVTLRLRFEADFADIFEVRGTKRDRRGELLPAEMGADFVSLRYHGLDGVVRQGRFLFSPPPTELAGNVARFDLSLAPQEAAAISVNLVCESFAGEAGRSVSFDEALDSAVDGLPRAKAAQCGIRTSNVQFNAWLERSVADLHMLATETPHGLYPYAGVPWFSTPFGRDGIITAFELLWIDPRLARGVLGFLAANQALSSDARKDAEPGKILHEMRGGEMAALGEVPFGRYYGSVDATPLFVMLAGAYFTRTGDRGFVESIWSNVERALTWIIERGDLDGDGFVEYERRLPTGLAQQGWKDSHDSVFHADGTPAEPPIALCEVQGYVYAAYRAAADLAGALGKHDVAQPLLARAERLRVRFEQAFWCEELGNYALALDGAKRPCRVNTSNPGHCLWTGIVSPERALIVADTLLGKDLHSGWGVRTLASNESRYNPMGYHNGSVWPHDNALIAQGLARYRLNDRVPELLAAFFEVSRYVELERMPELFCGFKRRAGEGPTLYPVACAPQAWAAGCVFMMLQSCLGLSIDGARREVVLRRPILPEWLDRVVLHRLQIGDSCADILLERHAHNVGISVLRREGDFEVALLG